MCLMFDTTERFGHLCYHLVRFRQHHNQRGHLLSCVTSQSFRFSRCYLSRVHTSGSSILRLQVPHLLLDDSRSAPAEGLAVGALFSPRFGSGLNLSDISAHSPTHPHAQEPSFGGLFGSHGHFSEDSETAALRQGMELGLGFLGNGFPSMLVFSSNTPHGYNDTRIEHGGSTDEIGVEEDVYEITRSILQQAGLLSTDQTA
jgi:hypothetical protein